MSRWKKILLGIAAFVVTVVALFLIVIGPWPVYGAADFHDADYYQETVARIDANVDESDFAGEPRPLRAGWRKEIMTPPVGTPLGGYSARGGEPSTGVRDDLYVRAMALSDGNDTVVLIGSDMLIVPPNIAQDVREQVALRTPLTPNDLYFTASHTHCGPGSFGPGVAAKISGGEYDPHIPELIAEAFADAIVGAYEDLAPAKLAHGKVSAEKYIRNRTRKAEVDETLNFMLVEQENGEQCYVMRFSAHPTNFGGGMMEFSAEYPGELMKYVERATGADAVYLGGAVGSMSPRAPEASTKSGRVEALGVALGKLVIKNAKDLVFESQTDIASVAVAVDMPPMQMRPVSPSWRISPVGAKFFGVPAEGWIQGVRLGEDLFFIGLPFDASGEISRQWQQEMARQGVDLWVTGFAAAYCGYLSPDKYYDVEPLDYETGLMSWFGPNSEAYFRALYEHIAEALKVGEAEQASPGMAAAA